MNDKYIRTCGICNVDHQTDEEDTGEDFVCCACKYRLLKPVSAEEIREVVKELESPVNPLHYSKWTIEPLEFITKNKLDFCTGNIIKYIMRHTDKNGLEDLEKARTYLDRLIKETYQG